NTPRQWSVDVKKAEEARQEVDDRRQAAADERRNQQLEADKDQLANVLVKYPRGETKTVIRDRSGLRTQRFNAALSGLIDDGKAEWLEITKGNGRKYDGYKPAGEPME